jgi:hypothetical protein
MAKQTQLEKAIASLDGEIAILEAAKQRLVTQQLSEKAKKPKPKPRAIAAVTEGRSA